MKKRMFITTIVMTLVLAIALTTSSLAWFSSANMTVTAQAATFTAKTAGSENVSLKISTDGVRWGNAIALEDKADLAPVIPVKALKPVTGTAANYTTYVNDVKQTIAYGNYVWDNSMSFNTALIDSNGEFVIGADYNTMAAAYTAIEYAENVKTSVDALNNAVTEAGEDADALATANAAIENSIYVFETNEGKNLIVIEPEMEYVKVTEASTEDAVANPDNYVQENDAAKQVELSTNNFFYIHYTGKSYVFNKTRVEATGDAAKNKVKNAAASDYYNTTFYLMNGDMQTAINSLEFAVSAKVELSDDLTKRGSDKNTANSYVAIIMSRNVETAPTTFQMENNVPVEEEGKYVLVTGSKVPANAYTNAGAYVIAKGLDTDKLPAEIGSNYVQLTGDNTVSNDYVPFAAFTFKIPSSDTTGSWYLTANSWQYADLDERADGDLNAYKDQYFKYNAVEQTSGAIARQEVEAVADLTGTNSYVLNTANLKVLNTKSGTTDETSAFKMFGKETFRVDVYFWLDGLTLDEFTDATVTTFGISVKAAQ